MEKLKPFIENLLFETIIPIMLITHKDSTLYRDDPIEYIRKQYDISDLFSAKNSVLDLLTYLCTYKSDPKAKRPDYIHKYLAFCVDNLNQY
jgi:Cse1